MAKIKIDFYVVREIRSKAYSERPNPVNRFVKRQGLKLTLLLWNFAGNSSKYLDVKRPFYDIAYRWQDMARNSVPYNTRQLRKPHHSKNEESVSCDVKKVLC